MTRISVLVSLYRCGQYIQPFLELCAKTEGLDQIEFLLLHNDPQPEEEAIIERFLPNLPQLVHVKITEREGLYATWNRGIKLAKGDYITVWNVDDIRFTDSIMMQARALDEHPDSGLAYGDIYLSAQYGQKGSTLTQSPEWSESASDFYMRYHISCFQMWRKSIHTTIGYYDEQFRCSADFDFQIRAALHFSLVKTPRPLGIYLLENHAGKLSRSGYQGYENNIIYLRYGAYGNLNLLTLRKSLQLYQKEKLRFFGQWTDFTENSPFPGTFKVKGSLVASIKAPWTLAKLTVKKIIGRA